MATVRFSGVNKSYGSNPVVSDLNLELPDGSFTVLVGPSGLRQVDLAAHAGRPGVSHLGHDHHRRPRRHPSAAARPRRRDGLPELRAVSAPHGAGEHRVSAASLQDAPVGRAQARRRGGRVARAGRNSWGASRKTSAAASSNVSPSAARLSASRRCSCSTNHCPTSMPNCGSRPEPNCCRSSAGWASPPLRHTRPGGGDDAVGPNGGDARRAHGAGGHAAGGVQHSRTTRSWRRSSAARR